jgi:hypothetical protein
MVRRNFAANISRANSLVQHKTVGIFPLYYWLSENGERKTVIRVPDSASLKEINTLQQAALETGVSITLEKATIDDWLNTHPT